MKGLILKITVLMALIMLIGGTVYGQCFGRYKNNCVNNTPVCGHIECVNNNVCQYVNNTDNTNNMPVCGHIECVNNNVCQYENYTNDYYNNCINNNTTQTYSVHHKEHHGHH